MKNGSFFFSKMGVCLSKIGVCFTKMEVCFLEIGVCLLWKVGVCLKNGSLVHENRLILEPQDKNGSLFFLLYESRSLFLRKWEFVY